MVKRLKNIELSKIKFDEEIYPRSQVVWQVAYDYSESMKVGSKFPPIVLALYRRQLVLVDGRHRTEAYKLQKKKTIKAEVYTGWNYKRIFEEAIRRNIQHGKSLSPYEKRRIALKLRQMRYNLKEVSKMIQVPLDKIEDFIGQRMISATTGKTLVDRETIVKSPLKHLAGKTFKRKDFQAIQEAQKGHVRDQIGLLKDLISLIKNGLLDTSNKRVNELLEELKILI
ncbi:hypothetical protein LCGC14_2052710 [marine sediment metagenome]|uniref:ParB/Sulfiredoxin domain-containing protein n=1 Tax=marine sediment metagenome TaxID=412755 RepID=A0A0F9ENM5_9ZZZZ